MYGFTTFRKRTAGTDTVVHQENSLTLDQGTVSTPDDTRAPHLLNGNCAKSVGAHQASEMPSHPKSKFRATSLRAGNNLRKDAFVVQNQVRHFARQVIEQSGDCKITSLEIKSVLCLPPVVSRKCPS